MFNPLRDFLTHKFIVGLEVDNSFIRAVQILNSSKGTEIDRIAFKEVKNPESIHKELREFFHTEKLKQDLLITCLPTSQAIIRQISISFDNPKKLSKIIKYQMEPYVPHPIDEMVVDFLPPRPDGDIITIGVLKKILSGHLESLSQAELDPKVVSLDDIVLFFLYLHNHPGVTGQAVSIINIGKRKRVVQIINGNRLEFIRILPVGAEGFEDLIETFNLYRLKNPDAPVGEVLITGHLGDDGDVAETLGSLIKIKTSIWRPFDEIKHRLGDIQTEVQTSLSVPLGLAVSMVNPSWRVFDLRKEEFVIKDPINPKRMSLFVLSIVLLLGLLTFNLYHKLYIQERRYSEVKENIRQLFKRAFPQATNIVKGRESDQLGQKIEEETGKYRWLEDITKEGTVLDVLMILTKSIHGFSDVKIDNISIEGKEIRLDGRTSSFETVDRLEKKLTNTGFFKTIKLVSAKIDKKDKAVKFNFAIEKNK